MQDAPAHVRNYDHAKSATPHVAYLTAGEIARWQNALITEQMSGELVGSDDHVLILGQVRGSVLGAYNKLLNSGYTRARVGGGLLNERVLLRSRPYYITIMALATTNLQLLAWLPWAIAKRQDGSPVHPNEYMGFPSKHLLKASFSAILLEDLPQLVIQAVYLQRRYAQGLSPDFIQKFNFSKIS